MAELVALFNANALSPSPATGLKSVQFGVATSTVDEFSGILGIGYGQGQTTRYKNFIDELSAQNATKVKAFTVALGSKHIQEGVIVFGGVDASKFSGTLARLPIIPAADSPDQVPRYWIQMQSLQLTPPSGRSYLYPNSSFPVFLDSGATMTLLPASLAAAIASDFGSTSPKTGDFYEVSCDLTTVKGTLDFAFDGTTVKVPYDELIRVVPGTPPACFLGISPSDDFTLLGDSFMRSAYSAFVLTPSNPSRTTSAFFLYFSTPTNVPYVATFDLENNVVWMTQAANCGSTPAALGNMNVMSTLQGLCGTNKAVATDNTNSEFPSGSAATVPGTSNGPNSVATGSTNSISMGVLTATSVPGMTLGVSIAAALIIGFLA